MNKILLIVLAAVVIAVVLSGCTQQDNGPQGPGNQSGNFQGRPGGQGFRNGSFGNMTPEQRQAQMQQFVKEAKDACSGKVTGDYCETANPRGARNGTCGEQNGTLACNSFQRGPGGQDGRGGQGGNFPGAPQGA
jgi:hypothetical protein